MFQVLIVWLRVPVPLRVLCTRRHNPPQPFVCHPPIARTHYQENPRAVTTPDSWTHRSAALDHRPAGRRSRIHSPTRRRHIGFFTASAAGEMKIYGNNARRSSVIVSRRGRTTGDKAYCTSEQADQLANWM